MNEDEKREHREKKLKALTDAYGYFEEIGIQPMLSGQTLLGAVREKDFIVHSPQHCVDISCKAELLTPEVINKIINDERYISSSPGIMKHTFLTFRFRCTDDINNKETIVVELLPKHLFPEQGYRVLNIWENKFLIWPRYHYDKYGHIDFLGKKWRTPYDIKPWLRCYYGSDWEVPNPDFHWNLSGALHHSEDWMPKSEIPKEFKEPYK